MNPSHSPPGPSDRVARDLMQDRVVRRAASNSKEVVMDDPADLKTYRANMERLAELQSAETFSNARPEHATIILETFLKYAQEQVVIFCQRLSQRTYGGPSLLENLETALRRKKRVSIIVQEEPEAKALVEAAILWKKENLPISISSAGPSAEPVQGNFAVMDQTAYRFEQDRDKPEAFACMNDPKSAELLVRRFSQFEQESTCILSAEATPEACQPQPA
jgi:ATPase subunit of ABC transporter with duplicated ATPase domains